MPSHRIMLERFMNLYDFFSFFFLFYFFLNFWILFIFIQQVLISYPFYTYYCIYVNRNLQFIPPPSPATFPPWCPYVCSLHMCLHFCLKLVHLYHFSKFHIYALIYDISFSLSDLLHSIWQTLDPPTSLQMTQFRSFLWLRNIPLYICTTSSLSIRLSKDI